MSKVGSIRFEIKLDINNSENYEISLLDLMKRTDQNINISSKDEVEEMNNYVKQMEKKYGPVAVVKGKKIRVNDFLIQGTGYDVDDPFIDDSGMEEAVVVAPDLMTQYGGFFINNDTLKLNESSFVIERVEGEDDFSVSSKQPFQLKNNKLTKSQQLLSQAKKRLSTTKKPVATTHTLDEIINNVVAVKVKKDNAQKIEHPDQNKGKKVDVFDDNSINKKNDSIVNKSPEKEQANINNVINKIQPPAVKLSNLPEGLPQELTNKIQELITISLQSKSKGSKLPSAFNVLIDIILSKIDAKTHRQQIFRHISQQIDMKYEYVIRKIYKTKEIKKKQSQNKLLKSLQESINEAMPASLAEYEAVIKVHHQRLEAQRIQNSNNQHHQDSQIINIDLTNEIETKVKSTTSKISAPKRNFKWTPSTKTLFFDLVLEELESFKMGKSKISPEEHLTKFFTNSVLNLWPPKWMTNPILLKVCAPIIQEFKSYTTTCKEFKPTLNAVTRKPIQNVKVKKTKEVVIKSTKLKLSLTDGTKITTKDNVAVTSTPNKVGTSPSKSCDIKSHNSVSTGNSLEMSVITKSNVDNHLQSGEPRQQHPLENNQRPKPDLIVNHLPISNKMKKSLSPPNVSVSKIIPQNIGQAISHSAEKRAVPLKEAIKRHSVEIISGSPAKSMMMSSPDKTHNHQVNFRPKNEENLSYLYNHAYSNHNQISIVPPCSLGTNEHHRISHHQNQTNSHYAHSSPYSQLINSVSPASLHKLPNHSPSSQSTLQSISTLFNSSTEPRQNIPHNVNVVNKANLVNNQHNLHQGTAVHRHYIGLQHEFDSPNNQIYHHPNAQTIDLVDSPSPLNAHQMPQDIYYNYNSVHFHNSSSNQRRFQN